MSLLEKPLYQGFRKDALAMVMPAPLVEPIAKDTRHILRFPLDPRFAQTRKEIGLDNVYSLSEVSELTGVSRRVIFDMCRLRQGAPVLESIRIDRSYRRIGLHGYVVLSLLDMLDQVPEKYITSLELARELGRTHEGMMAAIVSIEGTRCIPYITATGRHEYIPLYEMIGVKERVVDERVVKFVRTQQRIKQDTFNWEDAVGYFITKDIDVGVAQVFTCAPYLDREARVLRFRFLGGEEMCIPFVDATKDANKHGIRFAKKSIYQFARKLAAEQRSWMTAREFETLVAPGCETKANTKAFDFTLDGKKYRFELHSRGNLRYIQRDIAHAYVKWKALKHSNEHERLFLCYRGINEAQTEKRKAVLDASRKRIQDQEVYLLSGLYGIAVPIREYSGTEKVHLDGGSLIRFYLTLHAVGCAGVHILLKKLESEVKEEPVTTETILKLWILRDYYMGTGNEAEALIDTFFKNKRALELMGVDIKEIGKHCEEKKKEILVFSPTAVTLDLDAFYETVLAANDTEAIF